MRYTELLQLARKKFGLAIKGRPKKAEVEAMVAKASKEREAANDSEQLKANATALREMIAQVEVEAKAAEERATAIEAAQAQVKTATSALFTALVAFLAAVRRIIELGLEYEFPSPLTGEAIGRLIEKLTPPSLPKRLYVFWVDGQQRVGRGYVSASSFQEAKDEYLARRVAHGECWPNFCSWPAEVKAGHVELQENGSWTSVRYSATVHTRTLEAEHLYRFALDGPEYEGKSVVVAGNFAEAKAKALAGDIVEGDRPEMDADGLAELRKALDALKESGRVERHGHTLTTQTLV